MRKEALKRAVIYQTFIRNETKEGTFQAFRSRLSAIKELGADILYLLPVQKIGREGRKGTLGSPYAIEDYEAINPELGTWKDYEALIEEAHRLGLKIMQDIVYNHTSRDSKLLKEHPEWFYHNAEGKLGNKIGNWADVIDLDHRAEGLDDYLVDVLVKFKKMGVDGFRFDVATLIPLSFFHKARERLGEEMIFLAECVDTPFLLEARSLGFNADTNSELAEAGFDLFYPYGSRFAWDLYHESGLHPANLNAFKIALSLEEANLPKDKNVVMAIENHDRQRIASYSENPTVIRNILAFSFFNKGPAFLYSGEEIGAKHLPSLFDKDTIDFNHPNEEIRSFIRTLITYKHRPEHETLLTSRYPFTNDPYLLGLNDFDGHPREYGLFAFDGKKHHATAEEVPAGEYLDHLSGKRIVVGSEGIDFYEPMILKKLSA